MYLRSFMFAINISQPHQPYSATIVTSYCHIHLSIKIDIIVFIKQQTTSRFPVFSARSSVTFHNSITMAMKYSTRKFIEENKKLKQEVRKLKESVAILLQDVTCARIQLTETQARLNAMVYCLGSKSAEHKSTKGMLNLCLQEGARGGSQT